MDDDGDTDIVVTDRRLAMRSCRWLENPGVGKSQKNPWKNHVIGGEKLEVMFMTMADIDLDGTEEAVVTERKQQTIRIFKRLNSSGTNWSEQILKIPASTGNAKSVEVGDINGDGVPDLVLSTNTEGDPKVGLSWIDGTKLYDKVGVILNGISAAHNSKFDKVELLDIDRDGDLDVLICEENFGGGSKGLGVIWYENPTK
ncbi:MAG: VCBS repeat-containing protein [Cyclobacteriaceae bacterium]|nr:VCBS repeat-containing protein [Cyclobacteriaceae bacterium]